jgi:PAS domain S-box-containing protein
MKVKSEQAMPSNATALWAEEAPSRAPKVDDSGVRPILVFLVLAYAIVLGVTVWICVSGMASLAAQSAHFTDNPAGNSQQSLSQLAQNARGYLWQLAAAGAGGALGLLGVGVAGLHWMRGRWNQKQRAEKQDVELRRQKLVAQLADARVSEEEYCRALGEMQSKLAEVTGEHTLLQRELDQRRESEKSLAQQTQKLERSKDVLEMHVQIRSQEMQKLQRRNELILNSAGEGICGLDLQGKTTFVNPTAAKITGWKVEEMIGRTEAEIFFSAKARGGKESTGLLKNDKGEFLTEQVFHRKDGTSFPVEYVRTPIKEDGKVVGAVVMFKDITERRLAEDKLAHKAAELARSNAELEQFAFVASHDLQEPLRKIQAFGDRLKLKCEAVNLEEGRDYLERMQSASARMQTLIKDLLTFSRIIRASQPFTTVDLAIVTREVLGDLEHRIEKSKARVEVGTLPRIEADPTQMRQLLQNLIGNALKFQPPEASPLVKIDAKLATRDQIREEGIFPNPPPTADPEDKLCVVMVEDNGIGFEEQYLEKIFAVFQRLHGRSEYEGTGVGLAVCRRITDRHGGIITATSKPGQGSTFVVILPMQQPEVKEAA